MSDGWQRRKISRNFAVSEGGCCTWNCSHDCGRGPYRGILEKKAGEMKIAGSVIFTGMIPPEEVWKYYQAGDLFISASTSETQGMTYVEALAAGLPLLCRRDGCLEGVVREGENGWQYDDMKQFLIFLGEWSGLDEDGKFAKLFAAAIFFPMRRMIFSVIWQGQQP